MLLRARHVLPVSSDAIEDGAIVVRGGRIHAVGPFARIASLHPGERHRDLGDAILFPGFVNVHAHLELTLLRGLAEGLAFFPWIRRIVELKADGLKADEGVFYSLLGAAELIRGGTTTVIDCSDWGAPFDALAVSGLRGIVFQEVFAPAPAQVATALAALENRLDALQAMASDRVQVGISPHSTYMACAELHDAVLATAATRGIGLSVHAAESTAEDAFVRHGAGPIADHFRLRGWPFEARGMSPIEWLAERGWLSAGVPVQLVHLAHASATDLDLVAQAQGRRSGIGVAACPRSNSRLGNGLPDLAAFTSHGLPWGLGTDGAPSVGRLDAFAEMAFAADAERARRADAAPLPARELLRRVTLDAARSVGLDGQVGSIEVGKQADLAAVALGAVHVTPAYDPHVALAQLATPQDVVLTMVAGDVLYESGELTTIDEPRVIARCRERASILSRLGLGRV